MGELTLNSNTSLTVAPFRAVVQNTQDTTQGQYLPANDGPVTFTTATTPAVPTQDASQFRRAYVAVYVADAQVAGVASTATTDRAVLDILPGALAASAAAAAYPAVPVNGLILGELLIPPTGQAVTVTPYNQRTTARGAILPVTATGIARPGHDGDPGGYVGQYRDHPTRGLLQRWNGAAWAGAPVEDTGWVVLPTIPPAVVGSDGCAIRRVNGVTFFSIHATAPTGSGSASPRCCSPPPTPRRRASGSPASTTGSRRARSGSASPPTAPPTSLPGPPRAAPSSPSAAPSPSPDPTLRGCPP
jgi:hypothetical protein